MSWQPHNFGCVVLFFWVSPIIYYNFQQRMSRLPQWWRTQRNAIRNANCRTSWIIKILNAHCAPGKCPEAYLSECSCTPLSLLDSLEVLEYDAALFLLVLHLSSNLVWLLLSTQGTRLNLVDVPSVHWLGLEFSSENLSRDQNWVSPKSWFIQLVHCNRISD